MPRVVFTASLRRHIDAPEKRVDGNSVGECLDAVFAGNPALRGYLLDDQMQLRKHIIVFVDGERAGLSTAVVQTGEVYVMQALSGGAI